MDKQKTEIAAGSSPIQVLLPEQQISPVVFASPHSGVKYPANFVADSPLDLLSLRKSEDAFVNLLFAKAPYYGMPLINALFPRAYVDPNREPFELDPGMFSDPIPEYVNTKSSRVNAGLGTIPKVVGFGQEIYSKKLNFKEAARRIDTNYRPYHRQLRHLLNKTREKFGCYLLIDCHSMPSVGGPDDPDAGRRRADIVLGDCFSTTCNENIIKTIEQVFIKLGYEVSRNKPFAGGFSTHHYGHPKDSRHAIQIEINRGLYMDETKIKQSQSMPALTEDINTLIETLSQFNRDKL
tara:strand:+ start:1550 stop:2431 length:882 start_codon:yes stop_codon:yes gene_type:complete